MKDVTYQMHDLMHDLAKVVAGSESILVDQTAHGSWDKTTRHLSIDCQSESIVDHVCSFSHSKSLRTFLPLCEISLEKNALNKLMPSLRSLRVLDLSGLGIEKVPTSVGELIHLRFLNLSWNQMKRLPSSICSLRHLQSLFLIRCYYLEVLPEELGNLQSLGHLVLEGCWNLSQMPPGLAALTSLVTLDRLVVHKSRGGLKYLECLDSLSGSLEIELPVTGWKNATTDAERSFLSRKSRLHRLVITFRRFRLEDTNSAEPDTADQTWMKSLEPHPNLEDLSILNFAGKEMPHWVKGLYNLVILKLEGCIKFVELLPMSHLQFLKELHICTMSPMLTVVDSKVYEPNLFFPSLETLWIGNMPNLTGWWLQPPTVLPVFPHAIKVEIRNCPKLTRCMPLFPLVEDLRLVGVQEELVWHAIGSEATCLTSHGKSALKTLRIWGVKDLSSIGEAQIRHLSALHELNIYGCQQLEAVSCNGLAHLTSLERLEIRSCSKLNKWVTCGDEKPDNSFNEGNLELHRLRHLIIPNLNRDVFKGLIYMASLETLLIDNSFNEELACGGEKEEGMPWKHLQNLWYMRLVFGETFSMRSRPRLLHGFQHLTSLQRLTLSTCKELYLSWRVLLGLKHLRFLEIRDVEKVIDVDSDATSSIHELQLVSSSINTLSISGGSGGWLHDIPWKSFSYLERLWLYRIKKLEGLPGGIQHLAALRYLSIYQVEDVVSFPDWMSSLSSLNDLQIWDCSSELKKQCERLKGEDWPKIEHINRIHVW